MEEVQAELQKMNLPELDQKTLEKLMRTLCRYTNWRGPWAALPPDSRIEVLLHRAAGPCRDADLADAAAESGRTRTELGLIRTEKQQGEE